MGRRWGICAHPLLTRVLGPHRAAGIGFNDIATETQWVWSDGVGADFSTFPDGLPPWSPGEPNGQAHEQTDAAYMYHIEDTWTTPGSWDDDDVAHPKAFVCRRELDSGAGAPPPQYVALIESVPRTGSLAAGAAKWYEFVVDSLEHEVQITLTPTRGLYPPAISASFSAARPNATTPDTWTQTPSSWTSGDANGQTEILELHVSPSADAPAGGFGHGCASLPCVLYIGLRGGW